MVSLRLLLLYLLYPQPSRETTYAIPSPGSKQSIMEAANLNVASYLNKQISPIIKTIIIILNSET